MSKMKPQGPFDIGDVVRVKSGLGVDRLRDLRWRIVAPATPRSLGAPKRWVCVAIGEIVPPGYRPSTMAALPAELVMSREEKENADG
jgi:hypothetical protein